MMMNNVLGEAQIIFKRRRSLLDTSMITAIVVVCMLMHQTPLAMQYEARKAVNAGFPYPSP
jgi:hypothetical protein